MRERGRDREKEKKDKDKYLDPSIPPSLHPEDFVYGRHPVLDLLRSEQGQRVNKLWLLRGGGGPIDELVRLAQEKGIVFQWVDRSRLNEMVRSANHQGVVARVAAFEYASLQDFLAAGPASPLLLLDGVTDPHNLGAILRNAAFFGAVGVVIPRWRSAGLSGVVLKASAGAMAKVPLIQVVNIGQTILELKERNYWVYGADAGGVPCDGFDFHPPFALVIGSEGEGLHRLVRERCDALVRVPGAGVSQKCREGAATGAMESLNASVAAGVLLYEIFRRRKNA